jgi:membrane protease YdiL (CAAX protease family)
LRARLEGAHPAPFLAMPNEKLPGGFQLAFLILATEFFVMVACKHLAAAIGWPSEFFDTLGNLVFFPTALAVLFGVPASRRYFVRQLSRPLAPRDRAEVILLAIAKVAIPFALLGAAVIWQLHTSPGSDPVTALGLLDSRDARDARYFSALGLTAALVAISLGPFTEELLYRGLLYPAWERQWGWVIAMLLTSAAFGFVHPGDFTAKFLGSVVYVCLLRRTGALWAPIACHALYNFLVTWPLLGHVIAVKSREGAGSLDAWWPHIACLAFVAIALPLYAWHSRQR